jgi:hypothetical protein
MEERTGVIMLDERERDRLVPARGANIPLEVLSTQAVIVAVMLQHGTFWQAEWGPCTAISIRIRDK